MYEQTINFIGSLIPTRLETIVGGGVALVGVLMQHLFGEWNNQIEALGQQKRIKRYCKKIRHLGTDCLSALVRYYFRAGYI